VTNVQRYVFISILALLLFAAGCSSPRHFTAESLELDYVKRIVVLPFENNTETKFAGQRFRDIVTTEILSAGLFEVVERGEAQRFLREEVVSKEQEIIDQATALRLGEELKVEAYLAGSVNDFSELKNGSYSYPVVAATLRLVDVKTGQIIWQAGGSESGYRTFDRLFGFAAPDINQVGYRLAKRLLSTIKER
jgi:curli biogenesis system outer membrane secretion channel CsgG